MTVKEYLCRYHNILEEIKVKKQYIEFCKERESSISVLLMILCLKVQIEILRHLLLNG